METFQLSQIGRFMDAIEEGNVTLFEASEIFQRMEPLVAYFVLRFLREKYPPRNENTSGATARLIEFLTKYDQFAKFANAPKNEGAMVEWFDDSHSMREFFSNRSHFIETIFEKIEG